MYWWRIHELRADLINGSLSERARFQYLLIFVVLSATAAELPPLYDQPNAWDRTFSGIWITLAFVGTTWLYRVNGGSHGHRFIERYLSLSWVYLLRFLAFSLPVLLIAFAIGGFMGVVTEETGPFDVVTMTTWYAVFIAGLGSQLRRIVAAEGAALGPTASPTPPRTDS